MKVFSVHSKQHKIDGIFLSISCFSLPLFSQRSLPSLCCSTILFGIFHHNLDFISFIVVHAYITSKSINRKRTFFPGADMMVRWCFPHASHYCFFRAKIVFNANKAFWGWWKVHLGNSFVCVYVCMFG